PPELRGTVMAQQPPTPRDGVTEGIAAPEPCEAVAYANPASALRGVTVGIAAPEPCEPNRVTWISLGNQVVTVGIAAPEPCEARDLRETVAESAGDSGDGSPRTLRGPRSVATAGDGGGRNGGSEHTQARAPR